MLKLHEELGANSDVVRENLLDRGVKDRSRSPADRSSSHDVELLLPKRPEGEPSVSTPNSDADYRTKGNQSRSFVQRSKREDSLRIPRMIGR